MNLELRICILQVTQSEDCDINNIASLTEKINALGYSYTSLQVDGEIAKILEENHYYNEIPEVPDDYEIIGH